MDLQAILPILLPKAVGWAEMQQLDILASGRRLTSDEIATARAVGVTQPEEIRIKSVPSIPVPEDALLATAAVQAGLLGPDTAGLTLFYGIFIREGTYSRHLLAHECRHVHQYEQRGTIREFLQEYIPEVLTLGYSNSPLEKDARDAATSYELALATGKVNF
jgi:hypothetical protein